MANDPSEREFSLERGLKRLAAWWRLGLCTPAFYLAIGLVVKWTVFDLREQAGFLPMSDVAYRWLWGATVLFSVAASLYVARARLGRGGIECELVLEAGQEGAGAGPAWWRRYYIATMTMLALSDLVAFLGLTLFLAQGDFPSQAALSLLAWANYSLSKPAAPSASDAFGSR